MGVTSIRLGVMQMINQTATTGMNWFDRSNVGSVWYIGNGVFTGDQRERSTHTSAVTSGYGEGDVVGVHLRGKLLHFSKNGLDIPGKLQRSGSVYFSVQMCTAGDQVTVLSKSKDTER
mmetsp:Transcript_47283/g.147834  ORF Transcript_47283/g.147834 Transcript_47283/m.147834 type:complete len:118 (-) Transcript_47283:3409-3762(-)